MRSAFSCTAKNVKIAELNVKKKTGGAVCDRRQTASISMCNCQTVGEIERLAAEMLRSCCATGCSSTWRRLETKQTCVWRARGSHRTKHWCQWDSFRRRVSLWLRGTIASSSHAFTQYPSRCVLCRVQSHSSCTAGYV